MGDYQVRFWERLGVKFPLSTRLPSLAVTRRTSPMNSNQLKIEKHVIKIAFGFLLAVSLLFFKNYIKKEEIVKKSNDIGGLYYSTDLVLYALFIIGIGLVFYLVIPSMIY